MPSQKTRADSLREYITGALADGGAQSNPNLSLGGYRSSTEAVTYGLTLFNALTGVTPLYAGGGNPVGLGTLTAIDTNHLTWQPFGVASPGPPAFFNGTNDIEIVEALNAPGQYLRISGTTPFAPGAMRIQLSYIPDNFFGFDDITITVAASGENEYRATIVRNESTGSVGGFQRWVATLGTQQISNIGQLPASGAGTITTSGSFVSWPTTGWCRIQNAGGTLREIVYYSARTNTVLTVPSAGRGLLGTTAAAGAATDTLNAVPGVALALDPTGINAFGTALQVIANANTQPSGVTWNTGITPATGLQIGVMPVSTQVGIWVWRDIPAGIISTPFALTEFQDVFNSY